MKIYSIEAVLISDFPGPWHADRWPPVKSEDNDKDRVGPMRLEWQKHPRALADFIWPFSALDIVARRPIAEALVSQFKGARVIDVEMTAKTGARKTIELIQNNPYAAIWIEYFVAADEGRSSFKRWVDKHGRNSIVVTGIEAYLDFAFDDPDDYYKPTQVSPATFHVEREPGQGIYINAKLLAGRDFFRIHQIPMYLLCTENIKAYVEAQAWNNITFCEVGDTF